MNHDSIMNEHIHLLLTMVGIYPIGTTFCDEMCTYAILMMMFEVPCMHVNWHKTIGVLDQRVLTCNSTYICMLSSVFVWVSICLCIFVHIYVLVCNGLDPYVNLSRGEEVFSLYFLLHQQYFPCGGVVLS